ncbi:hypothetical protein GQ464_004165 [Rhodocaloribacter litoris]|uniref:SGNH/GDSL hydrolase family protein n=1 Tax=Rhodocaloribacter litoris TaxID=2558931 RepID=UPI0014212C8B|nr:GDSL-type esterase/lipase family protein [Rhodocaloribacter litoris]QXD16154.1 hypothetical protein GQ464_004165 [Rhodocaloribacter litoris]
MKRSSFFARFFRGLLLGAGALFLVVLLAELSGQALFRVKEGRWLYRGRPAPLMSVVFEHHPYLVGRPAATLQVPLWGKKVTLTAQRTRWTGAPADAGNRIRVAVLGGSAVFGAHLPDEDTWPARLQEALGDRYAVFNFGVPGYSTAEHVIQTALILPEVRPDVVVFYTGLDDLRNYHRFDATPEYRAHGLEQYENLEVAAGPPPSFWEELKSRSGLVRLTGFVGRQLGLDDERGETTPAPEGAYRAPDPYVDGVYRRNLETLRSLVRERGGYAVFVPQVVNEAAYAGREGTHAWTPRIVDDALPGLLRRFHGLAEGLCNEAPCMVLADLPDRGWTPEHFLDEVHFNAEGSRRLAEMVAARIRALPVRTRPAVDGQ